MKHGARMTYVRVQDYEAKLSDFGLARDGPQGDKSHVSTRVMGTYGYAAPEYVMTGKLCKQKNKNIITKVSEIRYHFLAFDLFWSLNSRSFEFEKRCI